MCVTASLKYSDVLEMDRLVSSFARQHLRKPTLDVVMGDWDQGQLTQYVVCSAASQMGETKSCTSYVASGTDVVYTSFPLYTSQSFCEGGD